jgi:ABC-type nitrate/sulfonate/bicarbonate transport system permease component
MTSRKAFGLGLEILVPIVVVVVLLLWTAGSSSYYVPPLTDVLSTFNDTWLFERVGSDVVPSLLRLAGGYFLACVIGVAAGLALGLVDWLRRATDPIVQFLRAIPPPALLPFAILILGLGNSMKVFIIAFVCLWPILLNTVDGVAGTEQTLRDTARIYKLGFWARLRELTLPAASPQIFAGMRTSLSLALIMMVISEMVGSTNGIGFFVLQSQRSFAIEEMWSGIILLGILGYVLNVIFIQVEKRVLRWHRAVHAVGAE